MRKIGIYNPYLETKGGGEKVCLALAESLAKDPGNEVHMISHSKTDLKPLESYFQVDLSKIGFTVIGAEGWLLKVVQRLRLPSLARNFFFDLVTLKEVRKKGFDVFINNRYQSNMPAPNKNSVYMCMFPQKLENKDRSVSTAKKIYVKVMQFLYQLFMHRSERHAVLSYKHITANSDFTRGYIKKYWERDSSVLYPICDNMLYAKPVKKEKIILNVGRFFENSGENHHKRQDILLETFAKMKKLHKDGWELHFAGSVAENVDALKYVFNMTNAANKLPVFFHFNCSFKELKDLYNRASIYWHATGYGSNAEALPEKQEHFGITTVESMSAGAIPVVINSAGQKESVSHGKNGYLWDTQKQLIDYTNKIAGMSESELTRLQLATKKSAKAYNKEAFDKRVKAIFDEILQ